MSNEDKDLLYALLFTGKYHFEDNLEGDDPLYDEVIEAFDILTSYFLLKDSDGCFKNDARNSAKWYCDAVNSFLDRANNNDPT